MTSKTLVIKKHQLMPQNSIQHLSQNNIQHLLQVLYIVLWQVLDIVLWRVFCCRCWMLFCDRCWMLFCGMCWMLFCGMCCFYDKCFVAGVGCCFVTGVGYCFVTGVVCCFVTGVGCLPQVPAPLHGDPLGQAPAACRGFTPVRAPVCWNTAQTVSAQGGPVQALWQADRAKFLSASALPSLQTLVFTDTPFCDFAPTPTLWNNSNWLVCRHSKAPSNQIKILLIIPHRAIQLTTKAH